MRKKRKRLKAETWLKLAIKSEEIERTPNDILADGRNVEEEAASLYEEMKQNLNTLAKTSLMSAIDRNIDIQYSFFRKK